MDKLSELTEYMNQIKLKKVLFGGYDKEDVQIKMNMMLAMFENCMKKQEEKEKNLTAEFEKQIKELQEEFESKQKVTDHLIVELNKEINSITEENHMLLQEQQKVKETYKTYCKDILKQYSDSLRILSGEFTKILESVSNMQKGINEETIFKTLDKAFDVKEVREITESNEE